jgi:hypothetical protein
MAEQTRALPNKKFLLLFLPALFLISFVFIRGNDIGRRIPILTAEKAEPACHTSNPNTPIFSTFPYGVIQRSAKGVAFFYNESTFGECIMSFSNGSWDAVSSESKSSQLTQPFAVSLEGPVSYLCSTSVCPRKSNTFIAGIANTKVAKLEALWSNGSSARLSLVGGLFYGWITTPKSEWYQANKEGPVVVAFNHDGALLASDQVS